MTPHCRENDHMAAAFVCFCKAAAYLARLPGLGDDWQMSFRSAASFIYGGRVIYDSRRALQTPPAPRSPPALWDALLLIYDGLLDKLLYRLNYAATLHQ